MFKRLASVAAASVLAGAALLGSTPTATAAGHNWESKVDVADAGDFTQSTRGHDWE